MKYLFFLLVANADLARDLSNGYDADDISCYPEATYVDYDAYGEPIIGVFSSRPNEKCCESDVFGGGNRYVCIISD